MTLVIECRHANSGRKATSLGAVETGGSGVRPGGQGAFDHTDSHRAPFYAISAYNRSGTLHRFINTTDVIAAIEDILGIGRLSKFDYFSRSLADIFAPAPDLTPYDPIIPTQDLNEKNPQNTAAARLSESLDLSAPDRVDDQLYNRILWLMLEGDVPPPRAQNHAALQACNRANDDEPSRPTGEIFTRKHEPERTYRSAARLTLFRCASPISTSSSLSQ